MSHCCDGDHMVIQAVQEVDSPPAERMAAVPDPNAWPLLPPSVKLNDGVLPFITFPLLKTCNLRCAYCGTGGELSASMRSEWLLQDLLQRIPQAYAFGFRKFRLTGGEPLLYRHFDTVLSALDQLDGVYIHLNTNGTFVRRHRDVFASSSAQLHVAVSLDSLLEEKFDSIVGRPGYFEQTIHGIQYLADIGRLLRLNMVVTNRNADEIREIIAFCRTLGCHLKLLDVVSVPLPYGHRNDIHVSLTPVESFLMEEADDIEFHEYARAFGTPCRIYVVNGVRVTVKNTWNGSRYDVSGICRGCPYFPCHEGLYDVFALPDGRVVGCRWSDSSVAARTESDRYAPTTDFHNALREMTTVFQRAHHVARSTNSAMAPNPTFVVQSLQRAIPGPGCTGGNGADSTDTRLRDRDDE